MNEYKLFDPEEYNLREVEPLGEMATIGITDNPMPMRVQVNPDRNRTGNPYFKVFNTEGLKSGETKVCRLHFFDSGMEYHQDKYLDWIPSNKDIKNIKKYLNAKHKDFDRYTNWQMTCWLWNYECAFDGICDREVYFNGEYDNFTNPSYVPSNTPIPETWEYDPPKGKNKRR